MDHSKTSKASRPLSRRAMLGGSLMGAGAMAAMPFWSPARAGNRGGGRRFVALYMDGGWDVLLSLDARDPAQSYPGIDLGTSLLAPTWRDPVPISIGGEETLFGAPAAELARHGDVMTLFRGVNMNTVAHLTGTAYGASFIQPAGNLVKGDTLGTRFSSASDYDVLTLPNFVMGIQATNESFPPALTAVEVREPRHVPNLVQVLGADGLSQTETLLRQLEGEFQGCVSDSYSHEIPAETLAVSRARMYQMLDSDYSQNFDFASDPGIMARYGIVNPTGNTPETVAATTWRLLQTGLTATVSARLQRGLDTHNSTWAADQPTLLKSSFDALAVLLDDLRSDDPQLENTTVVVYSEFSRTPNINGSNGRDHHFANSFLVFGGGLRPGICGATLNDTLGLLEIDVATGKPKAGGHQLRPEDIGATLAHAAGIDYDAFRTEPLLDWIA